MIILIIILVITITANYVIMSRFNQWESSQANDQRALLEQSSQYQAYSEMVSE